MAESADDEPTPITTWQGPAAPHDSVLVTTEEVIVRRPGVVGSTTGAGVGLPLLVFVVTLLGLLGYRIAGAAAATENTSSLSSLLPSFGRFTSSPPSPSRYYTNNNDVTSATTRAIEPRNSPRGSNNARAIASRSLFHENGESASGADSLLEYLQLRKLLRNTSVGDKEEEEAARSSSILRTGSIGDPLVIFGKTSYSASTYPESTEYRGQGYTSRSVTDVTENLRRHKSSNSRRGRRRRRRKNVDWEGDIRRKREDNEIRRNGIDPSRRESLISSTVWRKSLNIPPTIYDPRDIVNEPNESTRVDVDVDDRTGAALPTSKVAIIEDRGGKKTTRDTEQAALSNDKENSPRLSESNIERLGVEVSGSARDASLINGQNYFTSKVAATRVVNNHNNDSYTNIINNVNNRNRNHQRKYKNKNSSGSVKEEGSSETQLEPNEDVTSSAVTPSSPSEPITTELSYGNDESALEWRKSRKIAVPMTARSYPQGATTGVPGRSRKWPELPVVGNSTEKTTDPLERRIITSAEKTNESVVEAINEDKNDTESTPSATTNINATTEETSSTKSPSPTQDTSMEALSGSGYIVSVVLVLLVGALVGVLATVSHHLHHHRRPLTHTIGGPAPILRDHHRHHHRRHHHHHHHHSEETPASLQRRLLLQEHQNYSDTPMLSVSAGMEVGSGGHGGHGGLGGGLVEASPNGGGGGVVGGHGSDGMQQAIVAAARDRAIRAGSVRQDLALDLPPRLQLPDGEERPYGAHTTLHLRDPEQESEIYQKCVRPPPNRTVFDSESPPPYRSHSALLDPPDRIVRCHSAGSSLLRVFRKFPSSSGSTPGVVVPPSRRPTLSSYSESSGNLSNLSSLTVVPCEADETNHHRRHV
ncbi:uncharacterized protein [Venturia canescens]|uniref:uncharacterized protein n=1 Tax=Venturia canescens TaxID=32260 RepID=UPI001C9C3FCF|nr:uncharacterized protein LOC122416595 [Venturia canescens]